MYLPEILGWEFSTWSLWSLTHPCSCSYDKYMVTKITNLVRGREEGNHSRGPRTLSFSNTKYRLVTCSSVVTYQIHNVTNQIEGLFIYLKPILFFFII